MGIIIILLFFLILPLSAFFVFPFYMIKLALNHEFEFLIGLGVAWLITGGSQVVIFFGSKKMIRSYFSKKKWFANYVDRPVEFITLYGILVLLDTIAMIYIPAFSNLKGLGGL